VYKIYTLTYILQFLKISITPTPRDEQTSGDGVKEDDPDGVNNNLLEDNPIPIL
jgi:hypothetical protein